MWEQVKRGMVDGAKEVCGSVRVGGTNPKNVWWTYEVKAADKRKEAAWKEVLVARDEDAKERGQEIYKEEKRKIKRCIYKSKKEVHEQLGRKMNKDVIGNTKLFWKEISNENGGKVENCSRIKDGNGRLVLEEIEERKIWKEYFEDLYNIDTQEHAAVYMCGFDGVRRCNYF